MLAFFRRLFQKEDEWTERDGKMYLIAGLGNPSGEYDKTRHNVGFHVIDALADQYGIDVSEKKFHGLCGRGIMEGKKVILVKPLTFMNASGECVRAAADYYKIAPEDILVIFDDISLAPGQLRIRMKGSAGGHNGVKSIIAHLGTQDFPRIKVGIGEKPPRMDLADYVLSRFSAEEQACMDGAFEEAAKAAGLLLSEGAERAMNRYNAKKGREGRSVRDE